MQPDLAPTPGAVRPSVTRPPNATAYCRTCGRGWRGSAEAHCTQCHTHLSSIDAFDRHRVGTVDRRECLDPATAVGSAGNPLFEQKHGPFGITWRRWSRHAESPWDERADAA